MRFLTYNTKIHFFYHKLNLKNSFKKSPFNIPCDHCLTTFLKLSIPCWFIYLKKFKGLKILTKLQFKHFLCFVQNHVKNVTTALRVIGEKLRSLIIFWILHKILNLLPQFFKNQFEIFCSTNNAKYSQCIFSLPNANGDG